MKVKLSTIIFAIILSVFYLQIVSCNRVTNPNKGINEIDPKYLKPGQYQKTLGYKFDNDFTFHGWTNQKAILKPTGVGNSTYVKKLVSSQYFDIWVDLTNYEKAVKIKDTVWDELIRDLQRRYARLMNIYGARSMDLALKNNRYKVEIIFHENYDNFININGYFGWVSNISINANKFLKKNGIEDSKVTIIHELQHYMNYYYRNYNAKGEYYCYDEALSESTYNVIFGNNSLRRGGDFEPSRNGQYFFKWDRDKTNAVETYYRTAASFMYWLYIHGGEKIIKDIVRNKEINHKAIANAARINIPYYAGSEGDYNSLIFSWYKANFYNNPSGLLGYKNNAKINVYLAIAPGEKIELSPQCAVYTMQDMYDKNKNIGDTNIWLAKLSDSSRKWLLIYNSGSSTKTVYIRNSNIPIWGKEGSNLPVWGKDKTWGPVRTGPVKLIQ